MDKEILKEQFTHFYEVDLNNCAMTSEQWICELVDALSDKNYLSKFNAEYKRYNEFINQ